VRGAAPITTAGLAIVLLASLLGSPATSDYARPLVPARAAGSPRFAIINMGITAVWGAALLLVAGSQAVAGLAGGAHAVSVFGWLVPLGVLLGGARGSAGMWADYHERYVEFGSQAPAVDGLLSDLPPTAGEG